MMDDINEIPGYRLVLSGFIDQILGIKRGQWRRCAVKSEKCRRNMITVLRFKFSGLYFSNIGRRESQVQGRPHPEMIIQGRIAAFGTGSYPTQQSHGLKK